MYINLKNPEYYKYNIIDLNTGVRIPGVQEADDETGVFSIIIKDICNDEWNKFHFHGNIKIVKKEE
jgi:hypothetical protein